MSTRVWYCSNCGYEVRSRGKCHNCGDRLQESPLPELARLDDDDEVGYRLDDWANDLRGDLISQLIDEEIPHRFEEDELVVEAENEERVDALVSSVAGSAAADDDGDDEGESDEEEESDDGEEGTGLPPGLPPEALQLSTAARRLQDDPTDMQADAEIAEASTGFFLADVPEGVDEERWNGVGRVTRRLMAALGSEQALDDEIRTQAGILVRLLGPIVDPDRDSSAPMPDDAESPKPGDAPAGDGSETVYELGEWLPEQRAELALLLDKEGIANAWDGDNLVVASDREAEVEKVLDRIEAVEDPDADEEATYRAMEELFAATNRFVSDPTDRTRGNEVLIAVGAAEGPTPLGLDDAQWWQIRQRARILADSIEGKAQKDLVLGEAKTLRDLLRGLM